LTQTTVDLYFNYTGGGEFPNDYAIAVDVDFAIDLVEVTPTLKSGNPKVTWYMGLGAFNSYITGTTVTYAGGAFFLRKK